MIISGEPDAGDTRALLCAAQRAFCPNLAIILAGVPRGVEASSSGEEKMEGAGDHPSLSREVLATYGGAYPTGEGGRAVAYVCFEKSCSSPLASPEELTECLGMATRK